ncbi:MAG: hypothetical protein LAO79_28275 [Acidobacteriia bacterium]|nr:hypothetical protein [Terriglobia bacterium]
MGRFLLFAALASIALADISNQTITVPAGSTLTLDAGSVLASGGDLAWNGSTIVVEGNATFYSYGVVPTAVYSGLSQANLLELRRECYSSAPGLHGRAV